MLNYNSKVQNIFKQIIEKALCKNNLAIYICSLLFLLYTFLPFKNWLRWGNYFLEPFPEIDYKDAIYYMAQLREVISGNFKLGNPLILEHAKDGFSYGNSSLFFVWGSIGIILGTNVIQTYLIMVGINSILLICAVTDLFKILINKTFVVFVALIASVSFIGPLGRPSPTQQLLPILIFAITSNLKICLNSNLSSESSSLKEKCIFLFSSLIIVTGHPLYSILLLLTVIISVFIFKSRNYFCLIVALTLNILYICFISFSTDEFDDLAGLRLGIHATRIPGAIKITVPAVFILIILIILLKLRNKNLIKFKNEVNSRVKIYLILTLSILGAVNSQVVTGKAFEMESHYTLIWKIIFATYLLEVLYFLYNLNFLFLSHLNTYKVLISILVVVTFFNIFQFKKIRTYESDSTKILSEIKSNPSIKSVLIMRDSKYSELENQIIYNTRAYLYWNRYIVGSRSSQQEIISRFACTQTLSPSLNYKEYKLLERQLYFSQFANSRLKNEKWNSFVKLFGYTSKNFSPEHNFYGDYRIFLQEKDFCSKNRFKYEVNKII